MIKRIKRSEFKTFFYLLDFKKNDDQIWTSGTDLGKSGHYVWMSTGQSVNSIESGVTKFEHHKKHIQAIGTLIEKIKRENCLSLKNKFGHGLTFNDEDCSKERYFICEKLHGDWNGNNGNGNHGHGNGNGNHGNGNGNHGNGNGNHGHGNGNHGNGNGNHGNGNGNNGNGNNGHGSIGDIIHKNDIHIHNHVHNGQDDDDSTTKPTNPTKPTEPTKPTKPTEKPTEKPTHKPTKPTTKKPTRPTRGSYQEEY